MAQKDFREVGLAEKSQPTTWEKISEGQLGSYREVIMKIAKILLSIFTILFATLGLVKILPFDIANPIMLTSLATLLLLRSVEYKNSREKGGFILTCLTAVFVYVVVIYNVFTL